MAEGRVLAGTCVITEVRHVVCEMVVGIVQEEVVVVVAAAVAGKEKCRIAGIADMAVEGWMAENRFVARPAEKTWQRKGKGGGNMATCTMGFNGERECQDKRVMIGKDVCFEREGEREGRLSREQ